MTRNKTTLLLILLLFTTINLFSQKIRYRDYKNDFSTKQYRTKIKNQKYSPLLAGVCNYIIPSSGYFYVGEPVRGLCVLGSELIAGSVMMSGLVLSFEGGNSENSLTLMYSGMLATWLIQIWSVFDVVKIAKIKNLAFQENTTAIDLRPDLIIINQNNNAVLTCGLKLKISF